jgi:hypothetical protein
MVPVSNDHTFKIRELKPVFKAGFKNNIEIDYVLNEQSKGYFSEAFF